jgi:hypothetical protein
MHEGFIIIKSEPLMRDRTIKNKRTVQTFRESSSEDMDPGGVGASGEGNHQRSEFFLDHSAG